MKIERETITTNNYIVELDADEWLFVRLGKQVEVGLKVSVARQRLDFYQIEAAALIGDPVFSISQVDLEELAQGLPEGTQYVRVTFPAIYYDDVKKRLHGLPIPLPNKEHAK